MSSESQARTATLPFTEVSADAAKKIELASHLHEVERLLHELRHCYPPDWRRSKPLDWWLARLEPVRPLQGGRHWRFFGRDFHYNEAQAAATMILWEHRGTAGGWVSGDFVMDQLKLTGTRFVDLFRKKGVRCDGWGVMIGFDGRGNYRVNQRLPEAVSA